MSQWTHVVGAIQCSWTKEEAIEFLGKPVLWEDLKKLDLKYGTPEFEDYINNVWKKAFEANEMGFGIPMGSEGSIDWHFIETETNALGEGTMIAIEGDLRDFGGDEEVQFIIDWFSKATKKARFATLVVRDDWSDQYISVVSCWGNITITKYEESK